MSTLNTDLSIATFQLSLKAIAASFQLSKDLRKEISNPKTGFVFNAKILIRTRDDAFNLHVIFKDGKMTSGKGKIADADTIIVYKDKATLARVWSMSGEDTLDLLLTNEMSYSGNMAYLSRFSFLTGLLLGNKNIKNDVEIKKIDIDDQRKKTDQVQRFRSRLDRKVDRVEHLPDPYLADYSLTDFPRLQYLRNRRFGIKPTICIERADLLTQYHKANGFETDKNGKPINPNLRQAEALHYVLTNKKPIIWDKHLIPGSTTTKEVGVPLYPEFIGTMIWNELKTIQKRTLNPNNLSTEDATKLDIEIFPYWQDRTVREYCRKKFNYPLSQQLDERWVLYFLMKNNAIDHLRDGGFFSGLSVPHHRRDRLGRQDDHDDAY